MISQKMKTMVAGSSAIRAMFVEGARLAKEFGSDNVYDFSLGNPSVAPPPSIKEAIISICSTENNTELHGYNRSNAGFSDVREAVADNLNKRFATHFKQDNITMCVGAAGGLNVVLKTLLDPSDEVIVFAPFFGEYRNYVDNYDGVLVPVQPDTASFYPDLADFYEKITEKTKAVIINTPNNPTGVVYPQDVLESIITVLEARAEQFGHPIYLISDEPYRELVYEGVEVPYLTKLYKDTIVVYSYSKSLSLPGERIGYIVIPDEVSDSANIKQAVEVATRILGFVNAPSLQQKLIKACLDENVDVSYYDRNRQTLLEGLSQIGYQCIYPDGAFYLFVKSPIADDKAFCEMAKAHHILVVPGTAFGTPGYFRVAYCVAYETIELALPVFQKVFDEAR